ncbi:MAG TPA: DUF4265 domain-containing protein [Nakamurella sp.]
MSMSTDVRSAESAVARPHAGPVPSVTFGSDPVVVDVMFPLIDDEDWPPYPAESVDAVLIAHDLAEIVGVPWFVTNLSRGDIVRVHHDGIGYVGGVIVSRGGHSTLHVMAATDDELAPVIRDLTALGADVRSGLEPPMLAVDVPENVSLNVAVRILTEAESMTCAFTVASDQHRARAACA